MTSNDPYVRGYQNEVQRHKQAARRALLATRDAAESLLSQLDSGQQSVFSPRDLTAHSAEAQARLEAYDALQEVSFLTEPEKASQR